MIWHPYTGMGSGTAAAMPICAGGEPPPHAPTPAPYGPSTAPSPGPEATSASPGYGQHIASMCSSSWPASPVMMCTCMPSCNTQGAWLSCAGTHPPPYGYNGHSPPAYGYGRKPGSAPPPHDSGPPPHGSGRTPGIAVMATIFGQIDLSDIAHPRVMHSSLMHTEPAKKYQI